MAPKTWDERQIRYMNIARPKPGGSLEDRRKATASLPAPKLAPGVGLRKIRIPRLPLKGFEESASGDFEAFIFDPPGTHSGFDLPTLLFCHGGGYTNMSPTTHQGVASNFAAQGVRVVSIDYRLSPEHPFPAALTDAVSAYKHLLLNDGVSEEKIFFGGDSAGGGLALTLALWVRDHGSDEDIPQCAGLVLVSPYVDLTHSTPTGYLDDEFAFDTLLKMEPNVPDSLFNAHESYVPKSKPELTKNPLISSLLDNKEGLPPQFWALATADRLVGENLAMSIKRINLGEKCTIDIAEDQVHVYQFYNFIKQAGVFYKRAGEWIKGISEDPTSAPETTVNFIAYSGAVAEVSEGVEDLKKRLAGYLARDKTAAREKRGEYEAAAGVSKAKL